MCIGVVMISYQVYDVNTITALWLWMIERNTFERRRQREACALVVWWPLPSHPCMLYSSDRPSFGSSRVILALNYCLPAPRIHRQWCTTKTSLSVSFLIFRVFFFFNEHVSMQAVWGDYQRYVYVCVCCMFFVCYACIIPFECYRSRHGSVTKGLISVSALWSAQCVYLSVFVLCMSVSALCFCGGICCFALACIHVCVWGWSCLC